MKDQKTKKEQYSPMEMEVIYFETEDVITTSGNDLPDIDPFG